MIPKQFVFLGNGGKVQRQDMNKRERGREKIGGNEFWVKVQVPKCYPLHHEIKM